MNVVREYTGEHAQDFDGVATGLKSAVRGLWGIAGTVACAIFATAMSPFGALLAYAGDGGPANRFGIACGRLILRLLGTRVRVSGLENLDRRGQYIFVANHQSVMDIIALAVFLPYPLRFVAKLAVLRIPFFGHAVRRTGHVTLNLASGEGIRQALAAIRCGFCIVVFPEGHRFVDDRVHEFREGAAWLAIQSGLPCVPVAVLGGGRILPPKGRVARAGGAMTIAIGSPIPGEEAKRLGRKAMTQRMESAVRDLYIAENRDSIHKLGKAM